jgi:hypothetical protein
VRVQRAIFGEFKHGHSARESSPGISADINVLAALTDLPRNAPSGLKWDPFFRGFAHGDWYVITKTFPDPSASRPGMVKTFALILQLNEAVKVKDLNPLLALLPQAADEEWSIAAGEFEQPPETTPPAPAGYGAFLHAIFLRPNDVVVWLGRNGFLNAIASLWHALWPAARSRFRFGFHFTPIDAPSQPLSFALVPQEQAYRWVEFAPVDESYPDPDTPSAPEAFLRGLPGGDALRDLLSRLRTEISSIEDLIVASKCTDLLPRTESASPGELRMLLRYLVRLAPHRDTGAELKENVLLLLLERTPNGNAHDAVAVRSLYNLTIPDISTRADRVTAQWLEKNLPDVSKHEESREVITESLRTIGEPWSEGVLAGLQSAWQLWRPEFGIVLWNWWTSDDSLVVRLEPYLPREAKVDRSLAQACPRLVAENLAAKT